MKTLIIIGITTILTLNCFSQGANFFVNGSVWTYYTYQNYTPGMCYVVNTLEKDSIQGDTVINFITYKKMFVTTQTSSQGYFPCISSPIYAPVTVKKFIRYDSLVKKVYLLNDTGTIVPERLLYDFNLSVGDTAPLKTYMTPFDFSIIDSIKTISFFGVQTKLFYLPSDVITNYIIEGLGGSNGLTYYNPNWISISPGSIMTSLQCFQLGDSTYSPSGTTCPSFIPVGINTKEDMPFDFTVAPNPFTTSIYISFPPQQNQYTIKLMDLLGKEIVSVICSETQCMLETESLKEGIYFLQINNNKGNKVTRKLLKH